MKLPGVIVLYNPNILKVLDNIKSYIDILEVLYVFDNSECSFDYQKKLEAFSSKIKYYSYNENKGIAFALNYTSQIAYDYGFEWILTMDQDSSFPIPNGFSDYINLVSTYIDNNIALFSPYFFGETIEQPQFYTSGAIMNLEAWYKIKFDENLFIDEVDGDFTYRVREANYSLIKIEKIKLVHELGSQYCRKVLWKKLCSDNHSALRKYYIARNRIYLMKKRPNMRLLYFTDSLRKFVLFILIERNKLQKFQMILKGIYHGLTNRMGRY